MVEIAAHLQRGFKKVMVKFFGSVTELTELIEALEMVVISDSYVLIFVWMMWHDK